LLEAGLVNSKSEGRRFDGAKGVRLDGAVIEDPNQELSHPGVLQVGKRRFLRVIEG